MSEKRLTEEQFRQAIKGLRMADKTIDMVRSVLVDGRVQTVVAKEHGLTKGAVSQAVAKVWDTSQVPPGFERVEAVLPAVQAYQVKQWAKAAKKGLQK